MTPINDILNLPVEKADFLCQNTPLVCEGKHTVFLTGRRGRGSLLEAEVKKKRCYKCEQVKPISDFRQYKSGKNKGYYHSYCKECSKIGKNKPEYRKDYRERKPWMIVWNRINTRCNYDKNNRYRIRGLKVQITIEEIKDVWFRDGAYLLERPSIDRIDSNKNYTKENCRFIELLDNLRRKENKHKLRCKNGRFMKRQESEEGKR